MSAPALRPRLPDSLWAATALPGPDCSPLEGDRSAGLCVVGGGFTGLSAALHAAEAGAQVVLLEAVEPGWGASGRCGGQVIPGLKLDPERVERRFGPDRAERLLGFAGGGPDLVFSLIGRHGIDCQARREGWIQALHARAALAPAADRARQWRARGADVELLDRDQATALLGARGYAGGLLDRRGGWLQPLAFARGLARAATAAGAALHRSSPVTRIQATGGSWRVVTPRGTLTARQLLVCTNAYGGDVWPRLARGYVVVSSYQVATRPLPEALRAGILPKGHVASDTRRLLRYFCVDASGRLVLGGRGKLGAGDRPAHYAHLQRAIRQLFPQLEGVELEHRWSGNVAVTLDHLPRLLQLAPGAWAGIAYNGRGVALATAMGRLLAERAGGRAAEDLPLPETPPRPIPLHGLQRPAVELAVLWKRLQDAWDARRA